MENYIWKCAKCDHKWLVQGDYNKPDNCPGCHQGMYSGDAYYYRATDSEASNFMNFHEVPSNVHWEN